MMKKHNNTLCLTLMTFSLVFISTSYVLAQANYADSLRIENERSTLSVQLVLLRDSINQTIVMIDQANKKSSAKTAEKLKALSKELNQNKEQLDKLVNELSTTSQNGWSDTKVKRIQLTEQSIRIYYKAEKKKYARLVKQKKRTK
jgi:hypothetical protein